MNKISIFILFMLFSTICSAAGQTGKGIISVMYINAGWIQVKVPDIESAANNPDDCASTYYFTIHPNDANYPTFSSALLAAQMSQAEVQFWVDGCGGQNGQFPHIKSIWLRN